MSSLAVFIFPQQIDFSVCREEQTITIFNPYDFSIHFYFKSTRPRAFLLSATEGEILAKHSLDILVTLLDKTVTEEQFQIKISSEKSKKLGEKILNVTFGANNLATSGDASLQRSSFDVDSFQDLAQQKYEKTKGIDYTRTPTETVQNQYFTYIIIVMCFIILLLPHEENSDYYIIPVTINCKLVVAYILGIATVFLIRN